MSRRTATTARHRSAARPKTPLSVLATAVTQNAGAVGRRSAVLAASSGLAMTMGVPAATATTTASVGGDVTSNLILEPVAAPVGAEANQNVPQPEQTEAVSVPADVVLNLQAPTITAATPPPAPERTHAAATTVTADDEEEDAAPARESVSHGRPAVAKPVSSPKPAKPVTDDDEGDDDDAPAAPSRPTPGAGKSGSAVLSVAARYVGVMYRWGGTSPSGFDCSGYTQYVYAQVGVDLPRTSSGQASAGRRVSAAEARPGDLVWKPGHVGIYAGGNMMYDAPRTGKPVGKRAIWFKPVYIRVLG